MKRYILYAHDGSGNHGCEALVRSTAALLGVGKERLILVSKEPQEDAKYGIDALCTLKRRYDRAAVSKTTLSFANAYWCLKFQKDHVPMERLTEFSASGARRGDVALSIGGDVYCYDVIDELVHAHTMWKEGGLKTVYWGCSIEPELLERPHIAADIKRFDLITARETISYEALKKINPNTVLVTDSAFLLDKTELPLPEGFLEGNTVGVNVSPLIMRYGTQGEQILANYKGMIQEILDRTDMNVCLIPHVVWKNNDDRVPSQWLYDTFAHTGRVCMVGDHNATELKGFISRCRFFVGARTHATIAAYSTGVPTLVVGYSVKSRGIARDLFGSEEHYVLSVQDLKENGDLAAAFVWLLEHETDIRTHLKTVVPAYNRHAYDGLEALKKL